jgi:histidyl-tRNA synthetase
MAKQKKQPRPKAETPKGFRDYFGAEVTERNRMLAQIAEVYDRYGFDPLETSGGGNGRGAGQVPSRCGPPQ